MYFTTYVGSLLVGIWTMLRNSSVNCSHDETFFFNFFFGELEIDHPGRWGRYVLQSETRWGTLLKKACSRSKHCHAMNSTICGWNKTAEFIDTRHAHANIWTSRTSLFGYTVRSLPTSFFSAWSKFQYLFPCKISQTFRQTLDFSLPEFFRGEFFCKILDLFSDYWKQWFFQVLCIFLGGF